MISLSTPVRLSVNKSQIAAQDLCLYLNKEWQLNYHVYQKVNFWFKSWVASRLTRASSQMKWHGCMLVGLALNIKKYPAFNEYEMY